MRCHRIANATVSDNYGHSKNLCLFNTPAGLAWFHPRANPVADRPRVVCYDCHHIDQAADRLRSYLREAGATVKLHASSILGQWEISEPGPVDDFCESTPTVRIKRLDVVGQMA